MYISITKQSMGYIRMKCILEQQHDYCSDVTNISHEYKSEIYVRNIRSNLSTRAVDYK